MIINIQRVYLKNATLGSLSIDGVFSSFCLEEIWKNNQKSISCIPEGEYQLQFWQSPKFGACAEVIGVPNRSKILFHAGNSIADTEGCILPCSLVTVTTEGCKGESSRPATKKFNDAVLPRLRAGQPVKLIVGKLPQP